MTDLTKAELQRALSEDAEWSMSGHAETIRAALEECLARMESEQSNIDPDWQNAKVMEAERDGKAGDKEGLLPCPLCGSKAERWDAVLDEDCGIGCTNHLCGLFLSANKKIRIKKWNTRAAPPPPADQGEDIGENWYCATCKCIVPPKHVTYQETHDERDGGCGHPVSANMPSAPVLPAGMDKIREIIASGWHGWFGDEDPDGDRENVYMIPLDQFERLEQIISAYPSPQTSGPVMYTDGEMNREVEEGNEVLPYDVQLPGVKFNKGVKLSVFIAAAKHWREAWLNRPLSSSPPPQTMFAVKGPDGIELNALTGGHLLFSDKDLADHYAESKGYTVVQVEVREKVGAI